MNTIDITRLRPDTDLVGSATAVLKKGEGRSLKAGGLWIYDNEIAEVKGDFEDGDIISVEDFDGYFLGYGFINSASKIRVRVLSRRKENRITPAFLEDRVRAAWEYRKNVIPRVNLALLKSKPGVARFTLKALLLCMPVRTK